MDSESPNMDLWMEDTLNNWAEQGTLPSERSTQLHVMITKLAHQEKKNRFTRKAYGVMAAIITFIWLLFASCPVAAASYTGNPIQSIHSPQVNIVGLFTIIICFFLINHIQSPITNSNFEVNYE